MARISGVTIPSEKQVHVALTYVYGIGPKSSNDILKAAKVEPTVRVKDLTDAEVSRIQESINADFLVEGELQRVVAGNIKRLKDINAYRGTAKKVASKT
jgi:small subunit ribosomal protein S13